MVAAPTCEGYPEALDTGPSVRPPVSTKRITPRQELRMEGSIAWRATFLIVPQMETEDTEGGCRAGNSLQCCALS
jgi:hypothetical protein